MVRHHHRIAPAIVLTLALAAAAPASARPAPVPASGAAEPSVPASTNLCSEVCSAGGYSTATSVAVTSARSGATLPHDPRPRLEALAGGGSDSARGTVASSASSGPRSEVVSGGGYTNPSAPPTVVRVVSPATGFDWGDAGIGAGGAFALMMLLVGGILSATAVRRRATRSTTQPTT